MGNPTTVPGVREIIRDALTKATELALPDVPMTEESFAAALDELADKTAASLATPGTAERAAEVAKIGVAIDMLARLGLMSIAELSDEPLHIDGAREALWDIRATARRLMPVCPVQPETNQLRQAAVEVARKHAGRATDPDTKAFFTGLLAMAGEPTAETEARLRWAFDDLVEACIAIDGSDQGPHFHALAILWNAATGGLAAASVDAGREAAGAALIAAERQRQIEAEGWTTEHDDGHTKGELAQAAACYAWPGPRPLDVKKAWPWDRRWWKPTDHRLEGQGAGGRIRELVKAGALIAAEIERLQRAALPAHQGETK